MTKPTPKGFNCTKCGAWHEFPSYVYAHWRETLTHECECGTKHVMVRGIVMPARDDK